MESERAYRRPPQRIRQQRSRARGEGEKPGKHDDGLVALKLPDDAVGGLNEKILPVAYNDVDYCLRLQDAGYRVIYAAHAELYHHESASRGIASTQRELRRARRELKYMQTRWAKRMQHDPYYNQNLSYEQPNFTLNWKPRVAKPWR